MAVTNKQDAYAPSPAPDQLHQLSWSATAAPSTALQALTTAALLLPGLLLPQSACAIDDDELEVQYSHYQEGKRELYNTLNHLNPIEVDSIHARARTRLADRTRFAFNYIEDTWSGATPISTAPLAYGGNHSKALPSGTITTGASPLIKNNMLLDAQLNPVIAVANKKQFALIKNAQLAHTMTMASPETRRQGDFKLGYDWDNAALDLGAGTSIENDYESRFGNIATRLDFNQKRTSLNLGLSFTTSDTKAILDHDASPYLNTSAYQSQIHRDSSLGKVSLTGNREDWAAHLSISQVLSKTTLLESSAGYTRSSGFMENPYKLVTFIFVNPAQKPDPTTHALTGSGNAFLEQRPDLRNQWFWSARLAQYFEPLDAALHLDYRFYTDDWGILAHTFSADWVQAMGAGWQLTPTLRYYSQEAADFYQPYYLVRHKAPLGQKYNATIMPTDYSSDQRLSAYGTLSGGLTLSKQFGKGLSLETGIEYYQHAGFLKLGNAGEGAYTDFNYFVANANLKLNLSALASHGNDDGPRHHSHNQSAPAGVMFAHMLDRPGEFMSGYRYMRSRQAGDMLHGSRTVDDLSLVNQACYSGPGLSRHNQCYVTPTEMTMDMHMLDLMYAPTNWLNLMLMPQFVDMGMNMRQPTGAPLAETMPASGHITHHLSGEHGTGGIGDTGIYALFQLFNTPGHHLHLTLGGTAPTGDTTRKQRRMHGYDSGYYDYGMQLGSGSWDFKPSLSYTGKQDEWFWGGQLAATKRLQNRNESGYALGDLFQSTVWVGYSLTDWLSTTLRGVYSKQGSIRGQYPRDIPEPPNCNLPSDYPSLAEYNNCLAGPQNEQDAVHRAGPNDFSANYGGQFADIGLGISATVPSGSFAGHSLGFEWLQPAYTQVNGYQLNRDSTLAVNWGYAF